MKKKRKYSLILVIVVFVLSMGVFFLLYYVDNKYTARGDQAIQGILYVHEDDPLHYLTGEWEYYPDLLLTPGELEKHKGEYYSRYISIGEYGGMDLGDKDKSPFGSGTYRMTLVLPEKEKRYAIGLVEVFSSYNLYVNGNLVGQVGNPDPENYKEQIQNRVFTFEGKGNTEIMLAVTDRHSVSSGIQFVPVFGLPLQVNLIRGLSIVGDAVYLALTFCVFLFAVYMFVRTKKAELCFFALLCICVMGCSSYPLLHAFVPVKVQPAYGLEALFYYLMFACVVVVQQKILCDEGNFSKILAIVLAVAGVLIFVTELLCSGIQSAGGLYLVSGITEVMKWFSAFYLMFRSVKDIQQKYSSVLLVGITAYASSLAADRIWKAYEPIVGGWFTEFGAAVLVFCVGLTLWIELANAYRFQLTYGEYSRQMEQKLLMQKQHYEELTQKMDEISKMRHDMRHHLRAVMAYAQQERYRELMEYLQEYASVMTKEEKKVCYCRNMAVDAVKDQSTEKNPYVKIFTKIKNKKLLIEISNTYTNEIQRKEDRFYSTKHGGFGIGTASVTEVVQKAGGYVTFCTEDGVFKVNIFLPVKIAAEV